MSPSQAADRQNRDQFRLGDQSPAKALALVNQHTSYGVQVRERSKSSSHSIDGTVTEAQLPGSIARPSKRKGGRKPIYATAEERKQRNRQAQAAFRERRTDYVKRLESTVEQNEALIASLQQVNHDASRRSSWLATRVTSLEESEATIVSLRRANSEASQHTAELRSKIISLEQALEAGQCSPIQEFGPMVHQEPELGAFEPHPTEMPSVYCGVMDQEHHQLQQQRQYYNISARLSPPTTATTGPIMTGRRTDDPGARSRSRSAVVGYGVERHHLSAHNGGSESTRSSSLTSSTRTIIDAMYNEQTLQNADISFNHHPFMAPTYITPSESPGPYDNTSLASYTDARCPPEYLPRDSQQQMGQLVKLNSHLFPSA